MSALGPGGAYSFIPGVREALLIPGGIRCKNVTFSFRSREELLSSVVLASKIEGNIPKQVHCPCSYVQKAIVQ